VSGTPPRVMLGTDPVTLDPKRRHIRVFRRRPSDRTDDQAGTTHQFEAQAYHWGSLTTGHWLTAFWILLGPFAFANVAGWMNSRPSRLGHAAVRLVGLALTALLVAQSGFVFLEIVPRLVPLGWRRPTLLAMGALLPVLFVWELVMRLSTQSHFTRIEPGERLRLNLSPRVKHLLPRMFWPNPGAAVVAGQWDDPAGSKVTDHVVWAQHTILHRLRRIHLAGGCAAVVALFAGITNSPGLRWLALALAAITAGLIVATTFGPAQAWVRVATAWVPMLAITSVGAGWLVLALGPTPGVPLPGIHATTFAVALALGAAGLAASTAGLVSLGAVVIGSLFGASLGVGAGLLGELATGTSQLTSNGAGWVAVAMLLLVLVAVGAAAAFASFGELPDFSPMLGLASRVTSHGRELLSVLAVFGLAAGVLAFYLGCIVDVCAPTTLSPPRQGGPAQAVVLFVAGVVVLLMATALWRATRRGAAAVVVAGIAGLALLASGILPPIEIASGEFDPGDLVDLAKLVVILIPTVLIGRSMVGSIRRGTSNRQVGVVWDVASMWPRWFHPLAPPAYGPLVIDDLVHRLTIDPPEIVEAHSQGSVLATIAVRHMPVDPKFSLLTYGSPLGLLYRQLFPAAGFDRLVAEVDEKLGRRWVNLWRDTDPIGGLPAGIGDRDIPVRDGSGHSRYEESSDFAEARHRLV
jgi:hypothetical protein